MDCLFNSPHGVLLQRHYFSIKREKKVATAANARKTTTHRISAPNLCAAMRCLWKKLGGVAKRVGTRSDNLRADYFCFIPFSLLLKAGKCINAASHNADYTRVKRIKRAILLARILQTHCPGRLIPLAFWHGMLCKLISMRLLGRCRPRATVAMILLSLLKTRRSSAAPGRGRRLPRLVMPRISHLMRLLVTVSAEAFLTTWRQCLEQKFPPRPVSWGSEFSARRGTRAAPNHH